MSGGEGCSEEVMEVVGAWWGYGRGKRKGQSMERNGKGKGSLMGWEWGSRQELHLRNWLLFLMLVGPQRVCHGKEKAGDGSKFVS